MKTKCRIEDMTVSSTGDALITLRIHHPVLEALEALRYKDLSCDLRQYHQHRSLDANAYCWTLINQLADVLGEKRDDVYRYYIRELGSNCNVVTIADDAVKSFCDLWRSNGIGWITEAEPSQTFYGYTDVLCYAGSSTFDASQMCKLIDMIIQDCEAVGIPTATPQETAEMMSDWRRKK